MAQRAKRIAEENSHHDCDFRDMLSRVGDKWSLLVIFILKGRPAFRGRFSDLKRSIPGISQRMLTATVRNLERDGMLTRHVYAEVPLRVEYELTPLGRGLTEPVLGLVSWLQSNWPVIRSARDRFDARKKSDTRAAGWFCDNPRLTTTCPGAQGQGIAGARVHLPAPPPSSSFAITKFSGIWRAGTRAYEETSSLEGPWIC